MYLHRCNQTRKNEENLVLFDRTTDFLVNQFKFQDLLEFSLIQRISNRHFPVFFVPENLKK